MKAKRLAAWLAQAWVAICLVAAGTAGHAQDKTGNKNMWGKKILIEPASGPGHDGSKQMKKRIDEIAWMFGVPNLDVTLHVVGTQDNHGAIAELSGDQRRIYYGMAFDSGFENNTLESYVVLSHELAHHLLGHVRDGTTTREMELDADGLGACIVHALIAQPSRYERRRVYGTLADVKAIYDDKPSDAVHPSAGTRKAQVKKGWDYATFHMKADSHAPCRGYMEENALHRPAARARQRGN